MTIRPATRRDLQAILAMIQALSEPHGDAATITLPKLNQMLFGPRAGIHVLVAEVDSQIVGYAAMTRQVQLHFARQGTEIHHLFVVEPMRGQGIGRMLVAAAKGWALAHGHGYLVIGTDAGNRGAQDAYRAMGLNQVPRAGPRFGTRLDGAA